MKNFERFTRIIKYRIEEEAEVKFGKRPFDVDESKCKRFIDDHLSQPGKWAGAESLMAISELYEANIIGFNEKDTYYFATGYNANYRRFIAFQMDSSSEYYHYNSVCGIKPALMYKCVNDLSKVVFNDTDGCKSLTVPNIQTFIFSHYFLYILAFALNEFRCNFLLYILIQILMVRANSQV